MPTRRRTGSCAKRIFGASRRSGSARATAWTLITGESERLADNPLLARSIEHRFPYIDPLNHLQVELCAPPRAAPGRCDSRQRGIHLSINGIAAGLRNTG